MVETTGKSRAEAVARALEKLGIREQDANVTVLEERRARFLGLFGGPEVRVRVAKRSERNAGGHSGDASDAERVREVVTGILKAMQIDAQVRIDGGGANTRRVIVETDGSDGLLIGRHGQTLAALEHIANRILTHGRDNRPIVSVDVAGYRGRTQTEDAERLESRRRGAPSRGRSTRRARATARG
jgi:spoIIIJ-associated protein